MYYLINGTSPIYQVYKVIEEKDGTYAYELILTKDWLNNYDEECLKEAKYFADSYAKEHDCKTVVIKLNPSEHHYNNGDVFRLA